MAEQATTTPDDVTRYVDTDLTDTEIQEFIDDAENQVLRYNDIEDFYDGELDDLVKYFAVYLLLNPTETVGEAKQLQQNSRSVTLTTSSNHGRGWILKRIMANDPSGKVIGGRRAEHHFTKGGGGEYGG